MGAFDHKLEDREEQIHELVRERYAEFAIGENPQRDHSILDAEGNKKAEAIGYPKKALEEAPAESNMGLGCGNPLAFLDLQPGETVLDLGSGGGLDCFIAAKQVGPKGKVIGIDMTPEMVELAQKNAAEGKYANVEFRQGMIEELPIEDKSVDVIISNCVMNLLVNKKRGFSEARRVLKPGGRMSISDIVTIGEVPKRISSSLKAYTACLAGAIPKDEYLALLQEVDFEEIQVIHEKTWPYFRGYASLHLKAIRPVELHQPRTII